MAQRAAPSLQAHHRKAELPRHISKPAAPDHSRQYYIKQNSTYYMAHMLCKAAETAFKRSNNTLFFRSHLHDRVAVVL
jgi:hypothetical protein